jgi:hypothetical protein
MAFGEKEPKVEVKKDEQRWIFKSLDNFTHYVRGRKTEYLYDAGGKVIGDKKINPIIVSFHMGTVEISPAFAKQFPIPIEDVVTLMVNDNSHGRLYKLIWAPEKTMMEVYGLKEPDAGLINYAKRADAAALGRAPKGRATQGARAQANLAR